MLHGSVKPVLYLLFIADFPLFNPIALDSATRIPETHADDTAVLVTHNNHIKAFVRLQESLYYIQRWLKKCRIKANGTKSVQVTFTFTFTTLRETCPSVTLHG
jgi:hypothetical protein